MSEDSKFELYRALDAYEKWIREDERKKCNRENEENGIMLITRQALSDYRKMGSESTELKVRLIYVTRELRKGYNKLFVDESEGASMIGQLLYKLENELGIERKADERGE